MLADDVVLTTRRLQLRNILPKDVSSLYDISIHPRNAFVWRLRGTTPGIEEFRRQLYLGVLCQFVISPRGSGDVLGYVSAYNPDFRNRFVYIAVAVHPTLQQSGAGIEATIGFCNYLFEGWDFRLLLFETTEPSYDTFKMAETIGLVALEARIRDKYYYQGAYVDGLILSIRREQLQDVVKSRLGRALAGI